LTYDFSIIVKHFPDFLFVAIETLKITTASILFGVVFGLIIALMRISKIKILNAPAVFYVTIIRGTPILLQLYIVYFGISQILKLEAFPAAVIAFGVHNAAYIAEIFRGAINSIDKGQMEAARSLGMTKVKAMKRIVLPQAFKRAVPPLGNQFIIATKDSSLASVIGYRELLLKSKQLGSSTYHFLEYFIIAGVYYLIISTILSYLLHKVEKKLAVSER
jgi:polar amino acid transport system permease protein